MLRKIIYILVAFLILLALIGAINYYPQRSSDNPRNAETEIDRTDLPSIDNSNLVSAPVEVKSIPESQKDWPEDAGAGQITGSVYEESEGCAAGDNNQGCNRSCSCCSSCDQTTDQTTDLNAADSDQVGIQVKMAVVGKQGKLLYPPSAVVVSELNFGGLTVLGTLEAAGLEYRMSSVYSSQVVSICGQENKGMSGWMYQVNGEIPMMAAGKKEIAPGDKIIWWYSENLNAPRPTWESLTQNAENTSSGGSSWQSP